MLTIIQDTVDQFTRRLSTFSLASTVAFIDTSFASTDPIYLSDPRLDSTLNDVKDYTSTLTRLTDKRLEDQRYVVSPEKNDSMSKVALGAKVQRAVDMRYKNQDAVRKPRVLNEKKTMSAS